jgi:hypothetical protein
MAVGKIKLMLTNNSGTSVPVVLEPWAGVYTLDPGKSFDILAEGELELPFHLEISETQMTLNSFDSEGALLTIFQDGAPIDHSE